MDGQAWLGVDGQMDSQVWMDSSVLACSTSEGMGWRWGLVWVDVTELI